MATEQFQATRQNGFANIKMTTGVMTRRHFYLAIYALIKASRSAFIVAASVVGIPCGNPG